MTHPDEALAVAPPAEPARIIGRYELLIELASGGMGSVFVGRQRGAGGFQRLVAIKRMHAHVGADPELAAAFHDEAHIASLIRHPNVVNVHDVCEIDGEHLLVMDYIEGVAASTLIGMARRSGARLPRGVALRIAVDALHGLHAAHELRALDGSSLEVVHRDVSPQNILVALDGSVRITDFGIARAAQRSVHTQTGELKGKTRYMAPEHARGDPVDRRSDVFSLGIVLWEMLTGERLYNANGQNELLLLAAAGVVRPLSQVDPTMPGGLEAIVMRALAVDPDARWPTARVLAEQLEGWAWQARDLASASDVAATVVSAAGEALEKRRSVLQDVLRGKRPVLLRGGAVIQVGGTPINASTGAAQAAPAPTPAPPPAAEAPSWTRGRLIGAALLALVALVVGGAGALVVPRLARPDAPAASANTAATVAPATSMQAAAKPPAERRVRITLLSDREVAEIRAPNIDEVAFAPGSASFRLPATEASVDVTVRFTDGGEAHVSVTPTGDAALRVSARAAATAATTTPSSRPSAREARPAQGLRRNPYD